MSVEEIIKTLTEVYDELNEVFANREKPGRIGLVSMTAMVNSLAGRNCPPEALHGVLARLGVMLQTEEGPVVILEDLGFILPNAAYTLRRTQTGARESAAIDRLREWIDGLDLGAYAYAVPTEAIARAVGISAGDTARLLNTYYGLTKGARKHNGWSLAALKGEGYEDSPLVIHGSCDE